MKVNAYRKILLMMACGLAILSAMPTTASAAGRWAENHPRRAEVNQRLGNENRRINQERREGEISGKRAAQLHQEDRNIRQEERLMAGQNGGHITRQEQRTLNQQENELSRQIGR